MVYRCPGVFARAEIAGKSFIKINFSFSFWFFFFFYRAYRVFDI